MVATILKWAKKNKSWLLALSIMVVFSTTYLLILPALTLDEQEAAKQGGIDLTTDMQSEEQDNDDIDAPGEELDDPDMGAKTDSQDSHRSDASAEGELSFEGDGFNVTASCDAKAGLPLQTELAVTPIDEKDQDYEAYCDEALKAVQDEDGGKSVKELKFAYFYDISLMADGEPVEPDAPVDVAISYEKALRVSDAENLRIVHFGVDKKGNPKPEVLNPDDITLDLEKNEMNSATFAAESFSVYAVVYTVDFEWEVDGKKFEYSLPGGGFVSFEHLAEVLGIRASDTNNENGSDEIINLNEVEVSEATKKFVADVESIEFSSPELVDVSKVESETTVGQIKENRELECEYSAELTEEQIEEINAQKVEAGDWALISVQPFTSEETLTVTMKDGEVFTIQVTDASYSITAVTNLNGAKGALINPARNNAVQSTAHSFYGRLRAAAVNINLAAGTVTTTDSSEQLTEWTFTRVGESGNNYYIHSSAGYLNIANNGNVIVSDQPQSLRIDTNNNNQIRIRSGSYALNNWGSQTNNGYGTWSGGGESGNNDEWFTVYSLEQIFPVTLHFVKEDGSSFSAGEVTYADGTPVEIVNGNFKINPEKLEIGADGIIDLNQFLINGYTLSNTHKSTWQDINDSTDNYTHSVIGNELKWNNGTVQYRLFYTNHDKAGSYWFDAGLEPVRDGDHWQYNDNTKKDPSDHSTVPDNDAHPYDYYLVYDPIPTSSGSSSGHSPSGEPIDDIGKAKTLTPNGDGTYTMDLSVTTHAAGHEESNGINLVIVFDTSSSMRRNVNNANEQYGENDFKNHTDSRFIKARDALNTFLTDLCPNDNATTNMVQLALVDFNYNATTHTFSGGTGTPAYWTNSASKFMTTLDSLSCPSGTNWAQALETAKTVAATGDDDPTYILLMTDGAPSQYWDPSSKSNYFVSGEGCYLGARDEARDVVNAGYELYGVFSFGDSTDEENKYLDKLVDYAYNKEVHSDHSYYASSPQLLEEALESIFGVLKEKVAHIAVNYHDGIAMDTTSTALSANVGGNLGSITYSKTGGTTEDYSVTTDASGNAIFNIGGSTYPGGTDTITYTKISGSSSEAGGNGITVDENATATVYKCTVGTGDNAKIYYMPIATLDTNESTKVGDLNWDLSPLGMLEEGATYKISFVVWPNQEAYDYVAKLNNGIMPWGEDSTPEPVYASDGTTLLYYNNGVADYPNIVRYPDGTFAVLTNTMQEVTYYIATEDTFNTSDETTYTGQYTTNPKVPDPMPLTASSSQIEKEWNIERDPDILAQLLYGDPENHYSISFDIMQDENTTPYLTVRLGWDEEQEKYIWKSTDIIYVRWDSSANKYVKCAAGDEGALPIGTHWTENFSIATGLMLSEEQMTARKLDKSAYVHTTYNGTKYYLLEVGHDYTIKEPDVGFEFDFEAPVYHPMLVDGVLKNVDFENVSKDDNGKVTSFSITEISPIEVASDGRSALTIVNTLRGYIHLRKEVVDGDGNAVPSDDTEFTYTVTLTNNDAPFSGDHIPWYGISGLFYHDEGGNYYQAEVRGGNLQISTENGGPYSAECITGTFDPNNTTGQTLRFTEGGESKEVTIFGNQMNASNGGKTATATSSIKQTQVLNIANVPAGTTYTATESGKTGYTLIKINGKYVEEGQTGIDGQIKPNTESDVLFTNRCNGVNMEIQKLDGKGNGLSGAIFQLKTVEGLEVSPATGIGGLSTITKEINGETKAFESAFESNGNVQTLSEIPNGTYRLYEVFVPAGYISTYQYIQFDVDNLIVKNVTTDTGDISKLIFTPASGTGTAANLALLKINNTPGSELPSSGGPGTFWFYLLGGVLLMGCGTILVARRRARHA